MQLLTNENNVPTYTDHEIKNINHLKVDVVTSSPYPIPWDQSTSKPTDYYEKQSKTLTYYKDDKKVDQNTDCKKIEIYIPPVEIGKNRKRLIEVKVDGKPLLLGAGSILDMDQTFKIRDVNLLTDIVNNNAEDHPDPLVLQAIAPFIHLPEVKEKDDYLFNHKHHSDIAHLLGPYIEEMHRLDNQEVVRELLIPVVGKGAPHHWNLCVLSINEQNIPSIHYIESANNFGDDTNNGYYKYYYYYMTDYKYNIRLPINKVLKQFGYLEIEKIDYSQSKQFSAEGCGIAMSLNMQKVLEGFCLPIICDSNARFQDRPTDEKVKAFSRVISIEEDAVLRTEFVFKILTREAMIADQHIDTEVCKNKSMVCSEILSHPHSLSMQAREAFTQRLFKSPKNIKNYAVCQAQVPSTYGYK